uniref:Uncharacterized protein n=1 Tax=Peronospora matthiolae TaxID=2874970 RepID=A0AAV1VB44_9STRA
MRKNQDLTKLADCLVSHLHTRLVREKKVLPLHFLQQLEREKGTDLKLSAKDSQTLAVKAYFVHCALPDDMEDLEVLGRDLMGKKHFPGKGATAHAFVWNDMKALKTLMEEWNKLQV